MQLRSYQQAAIAAIHDQWRKLNRTLLVLPTGCGKTIVFAHVAAEAVHGGGRVLILAHRDELIRQAASKLESATGLSAAIEKADECAVHSMERVVIGSIQTLLNPLRRANLGAFTHVIVDECHHIVSPSFIEVMNQWSNSKVLGVTATADRADKKELGVFFESLAFDYPMIKAVSEGYLCQLRALTLPVTIDLRSEKPKNGDWSSEQVASLLDPYLPELARLYAENARDRKGLIFVPLCATGKKVQQALREHGLRAYYCSGEDRSQIKDFEADGPGSVCVNSMLLTEGYDHPPIDAIAVWRFTKSRPFFAQMVGRGTRLCEGKKNLLIIDNLFLTNKHELCRPATLFSEDDEIADAMQAAIDKDPGTDKALDEDLLNDGKDDVIKAREEALMKQLIAMRGRKRELVDPLQYAASIRDPFLLAYEPTMGAETRPVSQRQADLLADSGIYPGDIQSSGHAEAILQQLEARRKKQMATPKQIRFLEKMGFRHVGQFQFKYSSMLIGRIRANGWRLPDDLAEKIRGQK